MPCLLGSDLWKKSGRWQSGTETFKLRDRKGSEFLLGPTHEEEVTNLAASLVQSYKQLPLKIYQIGKKYRDEFRPRGGLLRAKEFFMKDLYSFDETKESAIVTYEKMSGAYRTIFQKLQVPFAVAEADSGNIGGNRSHEYHILSSSKFFDKSNSFI
jgi:prolyl-tRNA synthetase